MEDASVPTIKVKRPRFQKPKVPVLVPAVPVVPMEGLQVPKPAPAHVTVDQQVMAPRVVFIDSMGPWVKTTEPNGLLINFGPGPVASIVPATEQHLATVHLVMNGAQTRYDLSEQVWAKLKSRLEVIDGD